jgi:transposase
LEHDRGKSVVAIAESLKVSRQSVCRWIDRYEHANDILALVDAPHPGRPRKWMNETEMQLRSLLMHAPEQFGYAASYWTAPLLQEQLRHETGSHYSDTAIRRGLHQLEYVWKRPRYVLAADPEREEKTPNSPGRQWVARAQRAVG